VWRAARPRLGLPSFGPRALVRRRLRVTAPTQDMRRPAASRRHLCYPS